MQTLKKIIQYPFNKLGFQIVKTSNLSEILRTANNYYKESLQSRYSSLTDPEYLQLLELKYGGYVIDVLITIKSRVVGRLYGVNHTGGDRMNVFYHNYSEKYSHYLKPLRYSKEPINLLEVGILKGTGLAVWDEYFDNKKIFGFDYNLGSFDQNQSKLIELGAFKKKLPTVKFFDQFADNSLTLKEIFGKEKIDVIIDDAHHSDKSIINTFNELQPYLNDEFIYFVEDNRTAWKKLQKNYPQYKFEFDGVELTVVTKKRARKTMKL